MRYMRAQKETIHYIYTRMEHHSEHSGYDQITKYIPGSSVGPNSLHHILNAVPERVLAQVRRSAGHWYNSSALKQELQNIPDFCLHSNRIYHFLYGEDTYHYSSYLNPRKSNRFVASYHTPPEKFLHINRGSRHLRALDALVIIAPNQEDLFKNLVDPEKVHLIPHGVDTGFFHPRGRAQQEKKHCLFVGSHLRDVPMLREVIKAINKTEPEIFFTAVTFKENFKFFEGLANLRAYSSISEAQLVDLYRSSDILLLPLIDGTANNTILEAMACGLPVITTDVGGIAMYLPKEAGLLLPAGDAQVMAQATLALIHDPARLSAMSNAARQTAELFDWAAVAEKMRRVYQSIAS